MPALLSNVVLKRKKWVGGFLEPMAPLLVSQAGVLGSQPPVPVIALTGDDPAGAFSRRIASQIETDGLAAAVRGFRHLRYWVQSGLVGIYYRSSAGQVIASGLPFAINVAS
jgi:hypothetical protein